MPRQDLTLCQDKAQEEYDAKSWEYLMVNFAIKMLAIN